MDYGGRHVETRKKNRCLFLPMTISQWRLFQYVSAGNCYSAVLCLQQMIWSPCHHWAKHCAYCGLLMRSADYGSRFASMARLRLPRQLKKPNCNRLKMAIFLPDPTQEKRRSETELSPLSLGQDPFAHL